jgi:hypothetical protein
MPAVRAGAQKWRQRAQAAQQDYVEGVRRPRRRWLEATQSAQNAWAQGVQQALADGRWVRAINTDAEALWRARAENVGPQRYAQGIQTSGDRYERNFAPYRQVIESIQLPDRGPVGDPGNIQRVAIIAAALHEAKLRLRGGGG